MKRYPQLCNLENCVNCTACLSACNHGAIHFEQDEYGFSHPVLDKEKCVQCNLCELSCPVINPPSKQGETPDVYALYSRDSQNVLSSSSGGVFFEVAKRIIQEGGYVFGVVCVNGAFEYRCAENIEEVLPMRGSKYVQADIKDSLISVRKLLRSGKKVLFTGTPCLIAGLKSFLRKDYPDLLVTLEVVCHGTPSQKIFERCMQLSGVSEKQRQFVSFRDTKMWSFLTTYSSKSLSQKRKVLFLQNDIYMRLFTKGLIFKPKCYDCPYASVPRTADLTMGDFWGCKKTDGFTTNKSGTSVLLVNSPTGKMTWDKIKKNFYAENRSLEEAVERNINIVSPSPRIVNRETILSDLFHMNKSGFIKKYHLQITLRNVVGFVYRRLKSKFL